jgi:hypothetical protein
MPRKAFLGIVIIAKVMTELTGGVSHHNVEITLLTETALY